MKSLLFAHSGRITQVSTEANVLQALLAERIPVQMACGGKGLCATCHVYIEHGSDGLTPRTKREERTLALISESDHSSRLSCQAKVLKDGAVVRLPKGLYIQRAADLSDLVGRRAESRILHPVDGRMLVEEGKIITRSTVQKLSTVELDLDRVIQGSREV